MKVIDLLNKIANGEEVPKKIKIFNKIFEWYNWNENIYDYVWSGSEGLLNGGEYDLFRILDKEVEPIEEDKEIEYLKGDYTLPVLPAEENEAFISSCLFAHEDKINELIKAVNELKKGK